MDAMDATLGHPDEPPLLFQAAPDKTVTLELCRAPALSCQDGTSTELGRKGAALLCLLALDGACSRDTLALLLWPEAGLIKARASLRQRRHRLARAAGLPVTCGDEVLRLAGGVRHAANAAGMDAALLSNPTAVDGELLDGLDYCDCPDFQTWLEQARERWRTMRAQALARLASQFESADRVAPALALAYRLAEEEPLSDHAHRRLMRLHHLRGDLGAALEVYRRFSRRLDAELGEIPDEETSALAAQLRSGKAPTRIAAPVPPSLRRPPRLVGRGAEWAALEQAWGEGRAIVIEGAAGVGKSRLLADFLAQQADSGAIMLEALLGDRSRPYGLLVRLLSRLWLDAHAPRPRGFEALPDWARTELAALLPELGTGPARTEPLRLQRAVAAALIQSDLLAVGLDDVHQADDATLELLPSLVGPGMPLWWMTVRTGEPPPTLREWFQASSPPSHIGIRPFTASTVAEFLDDLALPGLSSETWAASLARHTGGLPLYLLETLRSLHGKPATDPNALPLPANAAQSIRARWAQLPEPARQLAQLLALWRSTASLQAAAHVLGGTPADWVAPLARLEALQWVDESLRMHDLVSASLEDTLAGVQRSELHARMAAWLQAQDALAAQAA